jgi:hypothetical protein
MTTKNDLKGYIVQRYEQGSYSLLHIRLCKQAATWVGELDYVSTTDIQFTWQAGGSNNTEWYAFKVQTKLNSMNDITELNTLVKPILRKTETDTSPTRIICILEALGYKAYAQDSRYNHPVLLSERKDNTWSTWRDDYDVMGGEHAQVNVLARSTWEAISLIIAKRTAYEYHDNGEWLKSFVAAGTPVQQNHPWSEIDWRSIDELLTI